MLRLIIFFLAIALVAWGLSWFADRPGEIVINWQGYEVAVSVFNALVLIGLLTCLLAFGWWLSGQMFRTPGNIGRALRQRKEARGLEALSTGIIAIGAGDRELAQRAASQARSAMPNQPLTELLRAQAAQLTGDRDTARRIFEAMLAAPDTELLGLRGLFLEAVREKEHEPARQFAERALRINPSLDWPVEALFGIQCRDGDWDGALETLAIARKHGHIDKPVAQRRRAVLLTGQALEAEDQDMDSALALALEAHKLAPNLVPAAEVAGRILASKGATAKAAGIIKKTWKLAPHPDLADVYAFARPGDSPKDRQRRVKELAAATPHNLEAPIAVANAAIEAHDWDGARHAVSPLLDNRLTQRVCTLMARIEGGEHGDRGRLREWLARAVNAPRDPAWTADSHISEHWAPTSPVTGRLDAFEWKVPVERLEQIDSSLLHEDLFPLIAASETVIDTPPAAADDIVAVEVDDIADAGPPASPGIKDAPPPANKPAPRERGGDDITQQPATARTIAPTPIVDVPTAPPTAVPTTKQSVKTAPQAGEQQSTGPQPAAPQSDDIQQDTGNTGTPSREAAIFVSPHAPDDPGPEAGETDDPLTTLTRYRLSAAKGTA